MKRSPTIREVAQRAGVSVATVSRTMNDSGPISSETRKLIDQVIHDSGLRLNNIGRQIKIARTHSIGVLIPSLKNAIFADSVAGIDRTTGRNGYNVLLASPRYGADKEISAIETFLRGRVAGLVLTVAGEEKSRALGSTALRSEGISRPACRRRFNRRKTWATGPRSI